MGAYVPQPIEVPALPGPTLLWLILGSYPLGMLGLIRLFLGSLVALFRSRAAIVAENLALRHQPDPDGSLRSQSLRPTSLTRRDSLVEAGSVPSLTPAAILAIDSTRRVRFPLDGLSAGGLACPRPDDRIRRLMCRSSCRTGPGRSAAGTCRRPGGSASSGSPAGLTGTCLLYTSPS